MPEDVSDVEPLPPGRLEIWEARRLGIPLFSRLTLSDADTSAAIRNVEANMARLLRETDLSFIIPTAVVVTEMKSWPAKTASRSRSRWPVVQLAVLVLLWLVLVAGPVAEVKLPDEIQAMLGTEVGTVALALTITQMMKDKRK